MSLPLTRRLRAFAVSFTPSLASERAEAGPRLWLAAVTIEILSLGPGSIYPASFLRAPDCASYQEGPGGSSPYWLKDKACGHLK